MAKINIAKAPVNSAVLPFYGTAALFFILLSILLLFQSGSLTGGYFNFHLLSIVHIAVLGWLTMIIFGAGYQLLPVICERNLFSEKLAFASFLLLLTGVVLLAAGFWCTPSLGAVFPVWGLIGGGLIFLSSLLFVCNVAGTSKICDSYSIQKNFILTSAIWLCWTTLAGFLLAWNLRYPYISKDHLELLKLHAHMGLAGWFLQLIIGVSAKLIPMFLLGRSSKNNLLTKAYMLINAGMLLFLTDGYLNGVTDRAIIYLILLLAGIACWMLYLKDVYNNRIKRPLDITLRFTGLSFINLGLTIAALILIVLWRPPIRSQIIYGLLAILGWLSALALGMTFKTLPFIVWNGHYKHLNGKGKIPLPKELYRHNLLQLQWWLYLLALYGLTAGLLLQLDLLIKVSMLSLIGTSLSYGLNIVIILRHKTIFIHATTPEAPDR